MRTNVDHLPERKKAELARIVDILHEEFADKISSATAARRKRGRILKIILFGSYARGEWTEDPKGGYFSDFDLLIIVSHQDFTDFPAYWNAAEDRLLRDRSIETVPQLIVHTLDDVNRQLKEGRYFFSDIIRDGAMLYELKETRPNGAARHRFADPVPPDPRAALEMASAYFAFWNQNAKNSLEMCGAAVRLEKWNEAAFNLHQATERAYRAFLLTRTLYVPKDHNIKHLRSHAEDLEPRLRAAWPRGRKPYRRYFELLKRAYVEARYSPHYEITREELTWLEGCLVHLLELVDEACREHLDRLAAARP